MLKQAFLKFTTDGAGAATAITSQSISGLIFSLEWYGSGLAATADLVVTVTDTGGAVDKTLLTLTDDDTDTEFILKHAVSDNAGGAIANVYDNPSAVGKIKGVIAAGGASNTAKLIINYFSP